MSEVRCLAETLLVINHKPENWCHTLASIKYFPQIKVKICNYAMGNCFENFKSFPLLNIDTKHYHLKVIAADKIFLVRNILSGGIWVVSRTTQIAWHQLAPHCNLTGWPRRTPGKNWDTTPACLAAKPNISFESCYPDLFVLPAALQGVEQTLVNMNDSPVCSNESPGCTGWSWSLPSPLWDPMIILCLCWMIRAGPGQVLCTIVLCTNWPLPVEVVRNIYI